ncbi:NF-X1-type zinc finger protein NFXL1, partial [Linum perenne]
SVKKQKRKPNRVDSQITNLPSHRLTNRSLFYTSCLASLFTVNSLVDRKFGFSGDTDVRQGPIQPLRNRVELGSSSEADKGFSHPRAKISQVSRLSDCLLEVSSESDMSFQPRGDRRDRSRSSSQTAQQRWVPRGPAPSTVSVNIPPSTIISSNVDSRVEQSNVNNSAVREPRPKGTSNASRSYVAGRPVNNHRRDKQREKGETRTVKEVKEAKDLNLPQLVQEIQEKLAKGTVECMICYDMVRRSAPIWSCSSCYSIFHLHCIKKWVRAPTSIDMSADKNQGFNWRCPGCQYVQLMPLKEISYVCFCGKRKDPPSDLYLTPHSCGEPCGKPLEKHLPSTLETKENSCRHVCVLQCHPGPCPPCKSFAPPCLCPCGKKTITTRCSDRQSVLTCGQQCDKLLDCKRHRCERICHVGSCDPCEILVTASCFCKKKQEVVSCGDMSVKGEVNLKDGVFSCNSTCGKTLACGNHVCDEVCHPGPCGGCALMPGRVKSCYCGKTSLQEERKSCLDPIPNCSQICSKILPCGIHNCEELCHSGDCPPCMVSVSQKCQCGSTSRTVACYQTSAGSEKFKCDKPCGRKKNCGRHRCSERCCPLSNPNPVRSEDWDPHFCQMACGKKLRCGQHSCESLCHSGHCPPCLETIFSDLSCACGRTSIPPPLPCGTPPPSCQLPCSVPQPCGHLASHSCHYGDCPPCSVPIAKECVGGHVVLKNIPCGSKDIRCNKLCGKTRQCGLHACGRTCHPAPCDSSGGTGAGEMRVSCGQTCGAPRRDCRHTCATLCHPSASCPDVRCQFPVTITCSCGRITASVPCDAGGTNVGYNADTVFEASIVQKLPVPLQPMESTTSQRIPLGQRKLTCDEECAKSERKRVLADAFDIGTPNFEALHFGDNSQVTELIADLYRRDPKWVLAVEERCKYLVLGKSKGTAGGLKVHVFCPMMKDKRDAVRLIAERWKLTISVAGWEPKRFVVLHATPKSRPPSRVICVKGTTTTPHSPAFDLLVDMDPRLVVSFLDLPREADVSSLVLRFGGECELIWLNDKNALAVFTDPARAATALRRLDHASAYHGVAVVVLQNNGAAGAWGGMGTPREGGVSATLKGDSAWKKAVTQVDSWGGEDRPGGSMDVQRAPWKPKEAAVTASVNRWSVLDSDTSSSKSASSLVRVDNQGGSHSGSVVGANARPRDAVLPEDGSSEVVDDWEKAYDMENDVQQQ